MPTKKKRYYNIRIDEPTYKALRKLAFKNNKKIIDTMHDLFCYKP